MARIASKATKDNPIILLECSLYQGSLTISNSWIFMIKYILSGVQLKRYQTKYPIC